jgi:hypothetical protein
MNDECGVEEEDSTDPNATDQNVWSLVFLVHRFSESYGMP